MKGAEICHYYRINLSLGGDNPGADSGRGEGGGGGSGGLQELPQFLPLRDPGYLLQIPPCSVHCRPFRGQEIQTGLCVGLQPFHSLCCMFHVDMLETDTLFTYVQFIKSICVLNCLIVD